jgi:tetratricopeptide (TPR) repeat protein
MTPIASSSASAAGRLQMWVLLALCGITLAVFGGVWGHEFVHYDDSANIYGNPHLKGLGWEEIKWMFTDTSYARRYMPLGWMSYAVDYQFFGLNPRAYHLGNLLLHAFNVVLLFFLLKRLLTPRRSSHLEKASKETGAADPSAIWCAAIGALFWAVNPLRVESVAWASSRIYCVVFLFTVLWLLAWLHARDPATPKARRSIYYWLSVTAYAASLLTYPLMLFAPIALFALEMVPCRSKGPRLSDWSRPESFRKLWLDKIPFLALAAGALALTFGARMVSAAAYRPSTLAEFSILSRAMQSFYIWGYYAWKPWAPYDLSATYSTLHSFNPLDVKFLSSAGLVLAATVALFVWRKRWPAALALWLCHLAVLVPALGLSEYPHSAYDRYSYLQGVLWSMAIALLLRRIWNRGTRGQLAGLAVVAASLIFALLAWQQVAVWRDTISLYRHMVAHLGEHPNRSRFDEVLGVHYLRVGLTNEAAASFQNAIHYESLRADRRLYDEGVLARVNLRLGDLLTDEDRLEEALAHYRAALKAKPGSTAAMTKLRSCLAGLNREAEGAAVPSSTADNADERR